MYSIYSKIQVQIQISKPKNIQKSQKRTKKGGTTYLPPTTKEKKSQSIVALPTLPLTLPYLTLQYKAREKKEGRSSRQAQFPIQLLRIERRLREPPLSLSFSFSSSSLFIFSLAMLIDVYIPESDIYKDRNISLVVVVVVVVACRTCIIM